VTSLGSDACQGFYFARPMLAAEIAGLIEHQADGTNPNFPRLTPSAG
jgi:EAL domain-containing protein (putative c-di-GMP-specific phosphodiesterase class I)